MQALSTGDLLCRPSQPMACYAGPLCLGLLGRPSMPRPARQALYAMWPLGQGLTRYFISSFS
jgi:hypothetical protein